MILFEVKSFFTNIGSQFSIINVSFNQAVILNKTHMVCINNENGYANSTGGFISWNSRGFNIPLNKHAK